MLDFTLHEPPHDVELEQAILGAILYDNAELDRLGSVSPDDFYEPLHAHMFAAMLGQWQTSKAVNLVTLRAFTYDVPSVTEQLTTAEYLRRLIGIGDSANVAALAESLRDYANRRRMLAAAVNLAAAARNPGVAVGDGCTLAVADIDEVLSSSRAKGPTRRDAAALFRDTVEAMLNDDGSECITSGLNTIDAVTGGWRRKQFAILAGRPSMGKSTVALSSLVATAQTGVGVLLFSLEMSAESLGARALSDLIWSDRDPIPYAAALAGQISGPQQDRLGAAAAHYARLPLTVDDQRGLTMAELAARTRAEAQRMEREGHRLGLVVVDHLGLIRPSGRYAGNKVQEVGEVSDALATLAKDQDVAVLALHQLNRGTEGRENKRPTLADLRNSGDLEQDADLVCFAYRQSYYLERAKCDPGSQAELQRQTELDACRNTLDILIAKNRNGPTTSVTLFCDMASNVVRDLA
jgi:replicative DNA helicase